MRTLTVLALSLTLAGCGAARWYANSFKGAPDKSNAPIAQRLSFTAKGTTVRVVVYNNDWKGFCTVDVDESIRCDFGFDRLKDDATMTGGWGMLIPADARKLCSAAMWSVRSPFTSFGDESDVQACATGLLELRFRELAPPRQDQ